MNFSSLIDDNLALNFLKEEGIDTPTEVQAEVIPRLLKDMSLDVLAPTGSGKTLAYVIPTVIHVKEREKELGGIMERPTVVVLAPTRELVSQIVSQYKKMSHHLKIRVRHISSGDSVSKIKTCGKADILVGAPGKIAQSIKKGIIDLSDVRYFIFDEADQLFEPGLQNELITIVKAMPKKVVTALFSATLLDRLSSQKETLFGGKKFKSLMLEGANSVIPTVDTYNMRVNVSEKNDVAVLFLKRERSPGIIFVNRKDDAVTLYKQLKETFSRREIYMLHGGMTVVERKKSYKQFIKKMGVMICTDIAARGIDIKELCWVLNFDLPSVPVYYIHRAGRVGRGEGNKGMVYNMVTPRDTAIIKEINYHISNQKAFKPKSIPSFSKMKSKKKDKKEESSKKKGRKIKRSPRFSRRKSD